MLISHMSEDDEINFYPPLVGGLIGKGLNHFLREYISIKNKLVVNLTSEACVALAISTN